VVYTLGVSLILSQFAEAQSALNFAKTSVGGGMNAGIAVTNPTSNHADVQFTLYGLDGNPVSSGLVNPVRYRVAPKGQLTIMASQLFAASNVEGWIQATSSASGLVGSYFSGDFRSSLAGANASTALAVQVVPIIREDQTNRTELVVLNPGAANSNVTITFFSARGEELGTVSRTLSSYAAIRLRASDVVTNNGGGNVSARISASAPVVATGIIQRDGASMFVAGQSVDHQAPVRVAAHFTNSNGFDPVAVLSNPTASPVNVTLTLFSKAGGSILAALDGPSPKSFVIPANGSISVDQRTLTGLLIIPPIDGWLRIDSPNVALSGLLVLDQGQALSAVPLQASGMDRMVFSRVAETAEMFTGVALVNATAQRAALEVSLVGDDGISYAEKTVNVAPNSKLSTLLRDVAPEAAGHDDGYMFIHSSVPLFGMEVVGAVSGAFLASNGPNAVPNAFRPNPLVPAPAIVGFQPAAAARGETLRVATANVIGDVAIILAGQVVPSRSLGPATGVFLLDVPATAEPGFVDLQVRFNGILSAPVRLEILPADTLPRRVVSGQAFYQKIQVTDDGLDLNHPVMVPIRAARVEVLDRTQTVIAVSDTDKRGQFRVPVPYGPDLTVRVVSRLRSTDLRVADNTAANSLYSISGDIDARDSQPNVRLIDNSRVSGAFNILDMIQRGNDTIQSADPRIIAPAVTVFWSQRNTRRSGNMRDGFIGTTYFNFTNNTAFVLGDRSVDSDEFDDSVIVHEYAHMLAARFSRDDSPGGAHGVGDMLDPRVAWSEGWANFFSCIVRNDAIYRDSTGPNGISILKYDLEDNSPAGDHPGYFSEASIDTLLWDLYDANVDAEDNAEYPFSLIWNAFTDLRNDYFVYLPNFLEHFLARNPAAVDALQPMVVARTIDFQPSVRPSVTNPFPRAISVAEPVIGVVDSLSSRRNNLVQSSHFLSFNTQGGAASIRLDILDAGPGGNPNANDLDLFLMDPTGKLLDRSDRGLNGQSELISTKLAAGSYVLEIRSYYTKAETNGLVFNSGTYRLSVATQ
jgi:hypothetical protein